MFQVQINELGENSFLARGSARTRIFPSFADKDSFKLIYRRDILMHPPISGRGVSSFCPFAGSTYAVYFAFPVSSIAHVMYASGCAR